MGLGSGELRAGDRGRSLICRGLREPRSSLQPAESDRGRVGELRTGHRDRCRVCRGLLQPRPAAAGDQRMGRGPGELRQGHQLESRLCRSLRQPIVRAVATSGFRQWLGRLRVALEREKRAEQRGHTTLPPAALVRSGIYDRRVILVFGEQGLGDTLQFCRYVKDLSQLGFRSFWRCNRRWRVLLASLAGASQVLTRGSALPPSIGSAPS